MSMEDGKLEVNGVTYDVVTLDYETHWGKDYTLSGKINTSEYVRDDRFHVHGVAIKKGNGKTLWYTGRNIALALKEIDWSKTAMIGHNTAFDGFITSEVYGHKPTFYIDTLSMSRATRGHATRHDLDTVAKAFGHGGKVKRDALANTKDKMQLTKDEEAKLGGYAVDDVDDTYKIFWDMYPHMPDDELRLVDITMRMFCDPVLEIDIPRVKAELENELGAKAAALLRSGAQVDDLMSNDKFARLLQAAGAQLPQKISPSTGKLTYAFAKSDLAFQDLMKTGNDKVRALCEARLKAKSTIGETRANRFLEAGRDGMKLPVLLNYSGAHTHRWSGGNKMNLQNLKRGGELRRSILAPKGHVVVVADSAQIEARVLAWLAGQDDVVDAFRNKRDLYSEFASLVFGYKVDRKKAATNAAGQYINKEGQVVADKKDAYFPHEMEGFVGKVCVLGLGYGMGWQKFQHTLKSGAMGMAVELTDEQCKAAVNLYRSRNYKIRQLWKIMDDTIVSMITGARGGFGPLTYGKGYIQLPNGLFLQYYGLHGEAEVRHDDLVAHEATYLTRQGRSKIYGGLLTENVVQALARVIIAEQMLKIHDAGYRIVTMAHDEIVIVAKKGDAKKAFDFMIKTMSTPPDWAPDLPLAAEGGYDTNYSK